MTLDKKPSPAGNLPAPLSSFIGRERQIAAIRARLAAQRLVTLTGPGGVGKTRLALRAARDLAPGFGNGVWLVEFAPLADPERVPQEVASALALREQTRRAWSATLGEYLQARRCLLIFDNCEHLVAACARLARDLLRICPELRILATSREPLGVAGESVFLVPPLSLPEARPWREPVPEADVLGEYESSEAFRLFTERAAAASSAFRLDARNAPWIADVCRRLDGIPLAIELAAAQMRTLSARQIARRLNDRLPLLSAGSRTAPARHQTLQATLDWSYALLSEAQQILLSRLAVFAGGWTLEAAEAVCAGEPIEKNKILALLSRLVDRSLVAVETSDGGRRYHLLETIRQYGRSKLKEAGHLDHTRAKHMDYYLEWTRQNHTHLMGPGQVEWMQRFETEHDNLRAALDWGQRNSNMAVPTLRMASACNLFWRTRGYLSEGRAYLTKILELETIRAESNQGERALALLRLAELAYLQSDYPEVGRAGREALELWRKVGPSGRYGLAETTSLLGELATEEGDYEQAPAHFEEALGIWRQLGNRQGEANELAQLAWAAMRVGNYDLAIEYFNKALVIFQELNNERGLGFIMAGLGESAVRQGRYEQAAGLLEKSLAIRRRLGHRWGIGTDLGTLGWNALQKRDFEKMRAYLAESLALRQEGGDKGGTAWCLEKLGEAAVLLAEGAPPPQRNEGFHRAVQTFAAAAAIRGPIGSVIDPADQPAYEAVIQRCRRKMGQEAFDAAWQAGKALEVDAAIELALQLPEMGEKERWGGLSPREREAAVLVARGLTNRQIAAEMTVRPKTVETYVTRILNKLRFDSRVQIAAWVIERGLDPDKGD